MSMIGVSGCAASLVLPMLSDRYGRRPVLATGALAGLILPLSVLLLPPQPALLLGAVLLGAIAFGCSPLYIAVIPTDTVPKALGARAIALVSACSALMGGVLMPLLAGRLADSFGLQMPLWMAACGAALACGVALCLRESAPSVLARRHGVTASAPGPSTIA
jgi:MFS family permease